MKEWFKAVVSRIKAWLSRLSFRTGVIILALCIPCYILSFAQMMLPISNTAKGVLWFILFGMAKTTQYTGLTIIGVEGLKRLKEWFRRDK
jgi:phosphoglycolate phosphatase